MRLLCLLLLCLPRLVLAGLAMPAPAPAPLPAVAVDASSTLLETIVSRGEVTAVSRGAGAIVETFVVDSVTAANEALYSATMRAASAASNQALLNIQPYTVQLPAVEFSSEMAVGRVSTMSAGSVAGVGGALLASYVLGATIGLLYEANGNVNEALDSLMLYVFDYKVGGTNYLNTFPYQLTTNQYGVTHYGDKVPILTANSKGNFISTPAVNFGTIKLPNQVRRNQIESQVALVYYSSYEYYGLDYMDSPIKPVNGECAEGTVAYSGWLAKNGAICIPDYFQELFEPVFAYYSTYQEAFVVLYGFGHYRAENTKTHRYNSYDWTIYSNYITDGGQIVGFDFPSYFPSSPPLYFTNIRNFFTFYVDDVSFYYPDWSFYFDIFHMTNVFWYGSRYRFTHYPYHINELQTLSDGLFYSHPSCFYSLTGSISDIQSRCTSYSNFYFSGAEKLVLSRNLGIPRVEFPLPTTYTSTQIVRKVTVDPLKEAEALKGFVLTQDVYLPLDATQITPETGTHYAVRDQVEYVLNPVQPTAENPYPYPNTRPAGSPTDYVPFPLPRYLSPHRVRRLTTVTPPPTCGVQVPCLVTGEKVPLPDSFSFFFTYDPHFPLVVPQMPVESFCAPIQLDLSSIAFGLVHLEPIQFNLHCSALVPHEDIFRLVFKFVWVSLCVFIVLSA
ncbi:hypothetical protein BegalDRAFT_1472 [Beggiatoa alba B18LD]|uniref:Uncharacterized protein n=1 Tax=Beggiatoa alba B18LD TaxID=395493 RepID=I3CFG7_9GAMM|nr:hypothetical protein [Beggiatoa alba]EIJ42360.1 hypothetical protein BegalDRAFT_1472 [Beggiatoa alba B18LD]